MVFSYILLGTFHAANRRARLVSRCLDARWELILFLMHDFSLPFSILRAKSAHNLQRVAWEARRTANVATSVKQSLIAPTVV